MAKTDSLPKIQISGKPTYVKVGENVDFYRLFGVLEKKFETCFILESLVSDSHQSRYSVIGFDPAHTLSACGNILTFDGQDYSLDNPYSVLQTVTPQDILSRSYAGGLVGYISYDGMSYFEPRLSLTPHSHFPKFRFGVYTDGLVQDTLTNELYYFYYEKNRVGEVLGALKKNSVYGDLRILSHGYTKTQQQHARMVSLVKEEICAGNTFQAQIGFKKEYTLKGDPLRIYSALRTINPSPYMYYLKFGAELIIGASPELLFQLKDGEMETFPLAGTIRRGKNVKEDRQLARILLNTPKELTEHRMLVDLHRNDLGRVARFGTVKVRTLMDVKKFSHVQHISSQIAGIIDTRHDMFSALSANFPAGTLTGAPKIESMKIIERIENQPRGPYGGGVGHFGFNGDCTFTIPIRTLFVSGEYAYTQASGGIVYDSNADSEYEEVINKMKAIEEAMRVAQDIKI